MIVDSAAAELDAAYPATNDMSTIHADSGNLTLSDYITGLDASNLIRTGCTYAFTQDGTVTQTTPP